METPWVSAGIRLSPLSEFPGAHFKTTPMTHSDFPSHDQAREPFATYPKLRGLRSRDQLKAK
jgi:hypothetical protein